MNRRCPKLPGLLQSQGNDASVEAVQQIASARIAAAGRYSVLVGCVPIHDILYDELDGDVPQILVGWSVSGIIADRQIKPVIGRLEVGVVLNRAWKSATARRRGRPRIDRCNGRIL